MAKRTIPPVVLKKIESAKLLDISSLPKVKLFSYYIDQGNEPKVSKMGWEKIENQSVSENTFITLNLELDKQEAYTDANGVFEGVLQQESSQEINSKATTTAERLLNAQTLTIISDKDIPMEDNVLRVFRTQIIPSSYVGGNNKIIELIKPNGTKADQSVWEKYERLYIKNYFLTKKSQQILAGKKTNRFVYTFTERVSITQKEARVVFSTFALGQANKVSGELPADAVATQQSLNDFTGVDYITIEGSKLPLINHITLTGNNNRQSSTLINLNSYIKEVSGTGIDKTNDNNNKWKLLSVKPKHTNNVLLEWYTGWLAEINYACRLAINSSAMQVASNGGLSSTNSSDGLVNIEERNVGSSLSPSQLTSRTLIINRIVQLLHWGATNAKTGSSYVLNQGVGLLRKAYIESGDTFDYPAGAIDYRVKDDDFLFRQATSGSYNQAGFIDNKIMDFKTFRKDNTSIVVSAKTKKWTQKGKGLYKPMIIGANTTAISLLKRYDTVGIMYAGLVPNSYYNSATFVNDFIKEGTNFAYQSIALKKFATPTEPSQILTLKNALKDKFSALNGAKKDEYLTLYYEDNFDKNKNDAFLLKDNGLFIGNKKLTDNVSALSVKLRVKRTKSDGTINYYDVSSDNWTNFNNAITFEDPYSISSYSWRHNFGTSATFTSTTYTVEPYSIIKDGNEVILTSSQKALFSTVDKSYSFDGDTEYHKQHKLNNPSSLFTIKQDEQVSATLYEPVIGAWRLQNILHPNKDVYKTYTLYGTDNSSFAQQGLNYYREARLKEDYFNNNKDWKLKLQMKVNNQTYTHTADDGTTTSIASNNDGYIIQKLALGIYCRSDITIKYYDKNNKLLKEKVLPASIGAYRFQTTKIDASTVKASS